MGTSRPPVVERLRADQEVWFISDLHLGDGTPSDAFFGKDRHLLALVREVDQRGAVLVIGGDAMDFHQAWSFTRILRAHQELLKAMSRLAQQGRLVYVIGNHDYDISLYREILSFRVCDELWVGDTILVQHGFQYDPFLANALEGTHVATKVHHLVERYLDTWIRIPLGEFYTFTNRLLFWLTHKVALGAYALAWGARKLGFNASARSIDRQLDFWARSNMGDPMCIFRPAMDVVRSGRVRFLVLGHSHLPGVVRHHDGGYVNTGTWTFASSHYVVWDGENMRCSDWITGREYGEQLYVPLLDGSIDEKDFWQWWRENYMGLLRFREGEERRGNLRGWESYIRDHQELSREAPLPSKRLAAPPPPAAPAPTLVADEEAHPPAGTEG
jgi:UDP-2,3-diacylglucosamine pyrophosphatase LpxH